MSGKVYSDVSCVEPNGFYCFSGYYYSFETGISGLSELADQSFYNLIGETSSHPRNHWGTPSFISKLSDAAAKYNLLYGATPNPKIEINDISLEHGGIMDVESNWGPPHQEHRIGVVADLRTIPPARAAKFRAILKEVGITGNTLIHTGSAAHWHIREFNTKE